MSQRTPIVGGNWKMNLHARDAKQLAEVIAQRVGGLDKAEAVVFPPFPYLLQVGTVLKAASGGLTVKLGAQDCYHESNGAFTGEVSMSMLKDVGVETVLAGHSERRHVIGESDELINRKVRAALEAGLDVVLCVGEKLEQRELGQTDAVNAAQTQYGLAGVGAGQMGRVVIAYEPVWAIGTGRTATPDDAQGAHRAIRGTLAAMFGDKVAQATRIQYGGSVKPSNAAELFSQPDIDGGLIGGASLKADDFVAIVEAASATVAAAVG